MASWCHMVVTNVLVSVLILFIGISTALKNTVNEDSKVSSFKQNRVSSVSLDRSKRSTAFADEVMCGRIQGQVDERIRLMSNSSRKEFAEEVELQGDSKFSLQLAWTGADAERIVVLTSEDGVSSLYLSDETGKVFTNITSKLSGSIGNHDLSLQKHPLDSKTVYVVSTAMWDTISSLLISEDSCSTFNEVRLSFRLQANMIFHPTNGRLILAMEESLHELYLSVDSGHQWKMIKSAVISVKWSTVTNSTDIFVITGDGMSYFTDAHSNVLERSEDLGATWRKVYEHVYTFGMGGKFLYTSAYLSESSSNERKLIVSTDGGVSWNHARLPSVTPDRFYSILDSTDGQIFLHVDQPGDTGRGTLYLSDATGIVFSKSLDDHLYPNFEDLTDFYTVQSMRGVYITSQLAADNSIHTVITYNRGGEWQPIPRPVGVPCVDETKKCYLQIHGLYSIKRGINADPPLSVQNAVGIILAHGHVAESLQVTDPDVYVSSDGGYTWRLALKGPHHYQIADHGSLLVAIPADTATPSVVKFSTDEGRCWITYNFTSEPIQFTGLLVEPGNRAMTVAIWGYTSDSRKWHTHVINFKALVDKQCQSSDYEYWIAHSHNGHSGCLFGRNETFRKLKADSWCYNGKVYKVEKSVSTCECTPDDFDCDYGYNRVNDVCIEDPSVKDQQVDICKLGHEQKFVWRGYHKIPGDICEGGFKPPTSEVIDLLTTCGDDTIGPGVHHGEESDDGYHDDVNRAEEEKSQHSKKTVVMIVIVLFAAIIITVVMLTVYGRRYRARQLAFRYMSIKADDGRSPAIPSSTSLYDDSSDEEPTVSVVQPQQTARTSAAAKTSNGRVANGKSKSSDWNLPNLESDDDLLH